MKKQRSSTTIPLHPGRILLPNPIFLIQAYTTTSKTPSPHNFLSPIALDCFSISVFIHCIDKSFYRRILAAD
jgi:hypothetical protein